MFLLLMGNFEYENFFLVLIIVGLLMLLFI